MITLGDYFGPWRYTPDASNTVEDAAAALLDKVNALLDAASADGVAAHINPATKNYVSGETYGGFRPQSCPQGAPQSSHKVGRGVDIYDPLNELDDWITDDILEQFGLYREAPDSTIHWCHLTDRAPHSGHRTFAP